MKIAKNLATVLRFLPILMVVGLLSQSCSNEPVDLNGGAAAVDPPKETDLLVNTWQLRDVQLKNAVAQFELAGTKLPPQPVTGTGSDYDLKLSFDKDGTVTSTGSYVQNIQVNFGLGGPIKRARTINAADLLGSGTWTRADTALTINNGVEARDLKILELTATSLIVSLTTTQTETLNGVPVTLTGTVVASFDAAGS